MRKNVCVYILLYPIIQVEINAKETPSAEFFFKFVMICGISAIPQAMRLAIPKANEISSFMLQRQSLKYFSTHLTHGFPSNPP